jgi:hypothetical protein
MDLPAISLPHHQATLDRFLAACHTDPHILAATLYGSHARGAADEWSDLDIGVVIADDAYDDFLAGGEAFLRQLGEPLFVEDFDIPGIAFFILIDGTEGELSIDRAGDLTAPFGLWRPLLDKTGVLAGAKPRPQPDPDAQRETLRRQIVWFWHDLSHCITALARGALWWAAGQLEVLRRTAVILARLRHEFNDEDAADDPYFKVDKALPDEALAPLRATFVPLEREALFKAVHTVIDFYRELAIPLAEERGLRYPAELERLILDRLEKAQET